MKSTPFPSSCNSVCSSLTHTRRILQRVNAKNLEGKRQGQKRLVIYNPHFGDGEISLCVYLHTMRIYTWYVLLNACPFSSVCIRLSMTIGIVSISTKSSFNLPTTTTPCVEQTVGRKVGLTFFSCLIGDLRCVRKHSCLLKSPLCTFNSRLGTNCDKNACHHRFGIFCML